MSVKKSKAVENVERAESLTEPLQIGMFLSNSQLKLLANFADDPQFAGNRPDGLMIRVGMFPDEGKGGKHTIEIIPYQNNFNASTKFENLPDPDFNKLIKYFEHNHTIGFLDIDLGYPEVSTRRFPRGADNTGSTNQNIYNINNDVNNGAGGGGPSQTYPRPGSNGNT